MLSVGKQELVDGRMRRAHGDRERWIPQELSVRDGLLRLLVVGSSMSGGNGVGSDEDFGRRRARVGRKDDGRGSRSRKS